ncbi:hypothetical protein [Mesorhizobium sp. LNHC209A00]|uniref:hypothetical protein n=1 Tax=Mesorhizobium TaxID=68287 RepID=UPI000427088F|nr:hypothetical protein [Mesorhizobium sp. LNHC209A00]
MEIKTICVGALALSVLGGAAFAGALDEPSNMQPFFHDHAMTKMKTKADFRDAWFTMQKHTQEQMIKECNDAAMSKPHAPFCAELNALGHHS